jgi:hypothetical protein
VRPLLVDAYVFVWKMLREDGLSTEKRDAYRAQLKSSWDALTAEEPLFADEEIKWLAGRDNSNAPPDDCGA